MDSTELAAWLNTLPWAAGAHGCMLKVGGQRYVAAHYRGLNPESGVYEPRFYVLGDLPPIYFTEDGDIKDGVVNLIIDNKAGGRWYMAGFATQEVSENPRYAEHHPHGAWWALHHDSEHDASTDVIPVFIIWH